MNLHSTAYQVSTIEEQINESLVAVEQRLVQIVQSEVNVLHDASLHLLEAGGKRLRPRLTLLSQLAAGGGEVASAIEVATAVELMHSASVVHDDINDHGLVRRGRPSINAVWGRTFALLTGDFLFTKVYELMAPFGDLNIELARAAVALVEGETLQASAVAENTLNRETYIRIISLKTAALFHAAAFMGASLGTKVEFANALGDFGYYLGMAFQITDDILDLTSTDQLLGKTVGRDRQQGKGYAAIQNHNKLDVFTRKLLENEGAAIAAGHAHATQLISQAEEAICDLPQTSAKQALLELAGSILKRKK